MVVQGGIKELAQRGNWTLVKSPRKVKEDRKRERDNLFREERMSKRKMKFKKDEKIVVKVVIKSKPDFCLSDEEFSLLVNKNNT